MQGLLERGIGYNAAARYTAAERTLRRGLGRLSMADTSGRVLELESRLLTSLSLSMLFTTGKTEALSQLRRARAVALESGSEHALTLTQIQEGALHVVSGDWPASLRAFEEPRFRLSSLSPREAFAALLNRGYAHTSMLDLHAGRRDLLRAVGIAVEHGLPAQEFKARHNLGCLEYFAGNLPEALRLMEAADAMDVDVSRARARLDHALVLLDAGLLDQAEAMLTEALATAKRERLRLDEGDIALDLAMCALMRDDLPAARRRARSAARAFASRGADARAAYAVLVRSSIELASGRPLEEQTEALVQPPDGVALTSPEDRLRARVSAQAALARGDLEACRALVARLRRGRQTGTTSALHERLLQARLAEARGDPAAARRVVRSASALLATRQHSAASLDVRASLALHGRQLARFDLDLAMSSGSVAQVIASLERWRAVSLRATPISPSADPVTAQLIARLRQATSRLAGGDGDVRALREEADRLQAEIAHRDWARREAPSPGTGVVSPTTLAQLRRHLGGRSGVALVLFEHRAVVYRIRVGPGRGPALEPVGRTDHVTATADRLRRDVWALGRTTVPALRATLERAVASSSQALDRLLLTGSLPPSGPIVLVPTPALASVPWRLLPGLADRPLVVTSSLSRWIRDSTVEPGMEGLGRVGVCAGPGLARSAPEVRAIGRVWERAGVPLVAGTGPDRPGTSRRVVELLGTARLVHIAAHGAHEEQNPLFSSLRMADGPVFAHEFPRPVRAEHVVLSACDAGRARTSTGNESLGIASALISLGARSVVAAVAPVPDDVAESVMVEYHRLLAAGCTAAESLTEATRGQPAAAVFTLFGTDWRAGIPQEPGVSRDPADRREARPRVPVP